MLVWKVHLTKPREIVLWVQKLYDRLWRDALEQIGMPSITEKRDEASEMLQLCLLSTEEGDWSHTSS